MTGETAQISVKGATMRLFVFLLVFPLAACPWLGISEIADSVQQTIKDHTSF